MPVKNSIATVPMTTFLSSSVTGTYAPIITGGLAHACFSISITNNSTQDITISFDGVNDSDYIPKATIKNIPPLYALIAQTNSAQFPLGTQIYVKGTAGTGDIYVAGYYQPQGV